MLTAIRIPRDTFASIVTERLRASIIDGTLKPGAQLNVALVDASGSPRLRRMFHMVISETRLCLVVLTANDAREDLVHEHRRICDLMQEGETEQALVVLQEALRRRRGHVVEATDTHRPALEHIMICHFWDRSALVPLEIETARDGNYLMGHRSRHGHGHGHGPSAADALTSGVRYCRPRVLDRKRDLLRDHHHISHATGQVEPTDHKGSNEVLW